MRARWLVGVGAVLSLLAVSCDARCVSGKSDACTCPDGRSGAQVCRSDGYFDPCRCTGPVPATGGGGGAEPLDVPVVVPASPMHVVVGDPLVLRVSHDGRGLPITWQWAVTGPDGGVVAALDDAARQEPLLTAPAAGDYRIEVRATTDAGSAAATFSVRASEAVLLPWEPVAFAAHRETNRVALAGVVPFRVELYDTVAGSRVEVALGRAPHALSFTPSGDQLVVAQDAQLEVISLTESPPRVIASWPVAASPTTLSASATHAYFPAGDRQIGWVRLATGEFATIGYASRLASLALHPDGARLYAAEGQTSFSDLFRLDLDPADGGVVTARSAPSVNGVYACESAWLSRDGSQAWSACGAVYRLTTVASSDMTYGGRLPEQRYVGIDELADGGLLVGLAQPVPGPTASLSPALALLIDRASLRQNSVAPLPDTTGTPSGRFRARFLFVDSTQRVHLFLTGAAGVPSDRTAWLTRTAGDL